MITSLLRLLPPESAHQITIKLLQANLKKYGQKMDHHFLIFQKDNYKKSNHHFLIHIQI